ncbi:rhophilin-1-like [Amphiura filiformis]|uniref:rhophilin-1-like n=1 Tax=Amphiura filiformis TaxID=82378 RepID=UPI003B20F8CA
MPAMEENGALNNDVTTRKGCDPVPAQSVRGRLQNRRSKLNHQINKEMRMRAGAENLFRAATNRKLKEQVALELSFVNSNLQLLKEELAEINSEVQAYQNDSIFRSIPLIPLGLKETKDLDIRTQFKDYIQEHYSEERENYAAEVQEFMDLRQAMRTPKRNQEGLDLLLEYYNQLYFIESRFFPPDRHIGIYFHWYDALTGVPSAQRSVAFEKGSVLFNMASIYTQVGAKQDRSQVEGIEIAIDQYQRAAGIFKYLAENFSHAPSMDMSTPVLEMLHYLMLGQVQECMYERRTLDGVEDTVQDCIHVAQEAAVVCEAYTKVHKAMMQSSVKDYIPYSWISMVLVKSQHFKASSHYYAALGFTVQKKPVYDQDTLSVIFPSIYANSEHRNIQLPQNLEERKRQSKAHIKQALMLHEEAMRVHSLSKSLRKIDTLQEVLKQTHDRSMNKYTGLDEEDDFFELDDVPDIRGDSQHMAAVFDPDFTKVKVKDIFHNLGPLAIFNARNNWSAPRAVELHRGNDGYGFTVRGDSPVIVASVDKGYVAHQHGVREGDFIVGVNESNVKWYRHEKVVKLILGSQSLRLQLITPLSQEFVHPQDHRRSQEIHSPSSQSSMSSNGTMSPGSSIDRRMSPRKGSESGSQNGTGRKKKNKVKTPDKESTLEKTRKSKNKSGMLNSRAGLW